MSRGSRVSTTQEGLRTTASSDLADLLANHLRDMVSIDFFTVPTARLRILFVFVVLAHHRRRVVHFNVTEYPTAHWTAQQVVQAFPDESVPAYLVRDRDQVYGTPFRRRMKGMVMEESSRRRRAPGRTPSPSASSGRFRRERLDRVIVFNERHLRRLLRAYRAYLAYHNGTRPHQALHSNSPDPREVQPLACGRIVAIPQVGGLHHRYQRVA